ncbi:3-hydroxyphenylacetate 6-hydroxylase [Fusarium oxysporum f. sp. albedinis]|nr:3-hydroxyphenylacetate 6-hydroxylase [Fusarium oxysporum f. sp. albedinis]
MGNYRTPLMQLARSHVPSKPIPRPRSLLDTKGYDHLHFAERRSSPDLLSQFKISHCETYMQAWSKCHTMAEIRSEWAASENDRRRSKTNPIPTVRHPGKVGRQRLWLKAKSSGRPP